jgi:hypothetical protein
MCIFTDEVRSVAGTRIFARLQDGWQYLAYEMHLASGGDTAMVLPLPVAPRAAEDAASFISLEEHAELFDYMENAFPDPFEELYGRAESLGSEEPPLEVHRVGAFDASFVPSPDDFARLDPRFQLPTDVWDALPGYREAGFAVFRLRAGESRVHPMALKFRTRETRSLFFPTVHVHARRVEAWARFDHVLFAQGPLATNRDWNESPEPLGKSVERAPAGLLAPRERGYRRALYGTYENRDTRVALET